MTEFDNQKSTFSQSAQKTINNSEKTISDKNQTSTAVSNDKVQKKSNNTDKSSDKDESILKNPTASPIWLSISEAAKLGGVNNKTIRRAIQSEKIKYKIYKNRYLISLRALVIYLHSNTKLKNKLNFNGIGQYIKEWRK